MRKDAQKGYARLAQTAERQTPTTTHTQHSHTHTFKIMQILLRKLLRPSPPPHHTSTPALRPSSLQQEACLTLAVERRTKKGPYTQSQNAISNCRTLQHGVEKDVFAGSRGGVVEVKGSGRWTMGGQQSPVSFFPCL